MDKYDTEILISMVNDRIRAMGLSAFLQDMAIRRDHPLKSDRSLTDEQWLERLRMFLDEQDQGFNGLKDMQ